MEVNHTRKVPWIEFIEIDLSNDGNGNRLGCASTAEIVHNKLLVGWMKAETGGKVSQVGCHIFFSVLRKIDLGGSCRYLMEGEELGRVQTWRQREGRVFIEEGEGTGGRWREKAREI